MNCAGLNRYTPADTLSLRVTVIEASRSRSKPDRGIIRSDIQVLNQHHDVVMTMKALNFLCCREIPGMDSKGSGEKTNNTRHH